MLLKKMNLNQTFGLSLADIDKMTLVERNYWLWMAKCIDRKKRIEETTRRMG